MVKKTAARLKDKPETSISPGKLSALVDARVSYCEDNLEQLKKLPDGCIDLLYIDPPFHSNRNYEVFWGETTEKRTFSAMPKKSSRAAGELDFMNAWYPIQVKQKDKTGRSDIDNFEGMLIREDRPKGFVVSFDYREDALTEIDHFFRHSSKVIVPLTVREIMDEQIARK